MSACISRHGEFGVHDIDADYVCKLCHALDEDALIVELNRLRADVKALRARVGRIAEAHCKDVDDHGGTYGVCDECGWPYPCPTYVWATTERDSLSTWDPADDRTVQ